MHDLTIRIRNIDDDRAKALHELVLDVGLDAAFSTDETGPKTRAQQRNDTLEEIALLAHDGSIQQNNLAYGASDSEWRLARARSGMLTDFAAEIRALKS